MKEDPREYWDNVPHELGTPPPASTPDAVRRHSLEEQVAIESDAEEYNDHDDGED